MINVILFGKPGAGKGTQADFLKKKFNLIHISTGDLFRNNIKNKTQLGLLAKSFMDKGDLVPDEVTKNSDVRGFIFDGFPRTISQAQALDKFLKSINMTINATISLEADDYVLEKRLIKRGMLNGRSDDQDISKIRNRFKEYNLKTSPLKKYYDDYGKLYTISGIGSINEIKNKLINLIKKIN